MSDRRTRDLKRTAFAEGTPESVANFLTARIREEADDMALLEDLDPFVSDVRRKALRLMMTQVGRQTLLEAMVILGDQIDHALRHAIQPRAGDAPLPRREDILSSIHRILTPEQASNLKELCELRLVIVPETSAARYREELHEAGQTMEDSRELHISHFAQIQLDDRALEGQVEGNSIKKWRFALTEGAQVFPAPTWDNVRENLEQRILYADARYGQYGVTRLDYRSYIALMIQGLRQGRPIDCEYEVHSRKRDAKTISSQYTLLHEINAAHGRVGVGNWRDLHRRVDLDIRNLGNQNEHARFRPTVMGNLV